PARAPKNRFELLNNVAVTANRTVEPLQVAVDDEDQIVELFARGKRDRSQRFRFVCFSVADEGPDFCITLFLECPILEVTTKARLIDRHNRSKSHRHRWEFPELRHEPRVRIGRQATLGFQLTAKVV